MPNSLVICFSTCFMLLFAGGCSYLYPRQELDPKVYYRHDMKVWVDDQASEGTLISPLKKKYHIKLQSPGQIDLLKIITCHREIGVQGASGFIISNKNYEFDYEPLPGLEYDRPCMLRLEAYEEKKQKK